MKEITHQQQKDAWESEHAKPLALLQMDAVEASSGVERFYDSVLSKIAYPITGVEMGCGKGRNVIWLGLQKNIEKAYGFDFSTNAIAEAKKRAETNSLVEKTDFKVADATAAWPYESASMDFGIDCFASTDIESKEARMFAAKEFGRVLKPGGHLMVYALSTDDEFHKAMSEKSPTAESGAFINPNGKFEKSFTEAELIDLHGDLELVTNDRIPKKATFYGKQYNCNHYWMIFKKI